MSWVLEFVAGDERVWKQIVENILSGQALYLYSHTLPGIMAAAMISAIAEIVRTELNRLAEQRLIQQRHEMALTSYEDLRCQHEEVMMLRHDMARHLRTLQSMSDEAQIKAYLAELIGQNEKIPSIVSSNGFLAVICENSFDGSAAKQIFQTNGLQTHGLGLKIIENTVEKYRGVMDTQHKNGWFRIRIIVPLESSAAVAAE